MAVRLSIEGAFVYFGWRTFRTTLRLRWTAQPLIDGSLVRRAHIAVGLPYLLINLFVILPLDVVKAIVYTIPAGFHFMEPEEETLTTGDPSTPPHNWEKRRL
jgi:hypothetical protein